MLGAPQCADCSFAMSGMFAVGDAGELLCEECVNERFASLTARVEAQAARIEELEGDVAGLRAGMLLIWGSCEAHAHHEISTAELVRMVREEVSRALQARGDDDGE